MVNAARIKHLNKGELQKFGYSYVTVLIDGYYRFL